MSKRNTRAGWALTALAGSAFMIADSIGYGSDKGYNLGFALGLAGVFALGSITLFAVNVATYKR